MAERLSRRKKDDPLAIPDARFEGSAFSSAELRFLLEHLGELSIVAFGGDADDELPDGVNPAQVEAILDRTYQLQLLQDSMQQKSGDDTLEIWCGFDKLKEVCMSTLSWREQVQELRKRTRNAPAEIRRAAAAPSLHMWDPTTDIPYLGGIGADADRVLTALTADGGRENLFTELRAGGEGTLRSLAGIASFLKGKKQIDSQTKMVASTPTELIYTEKEGTTAAIVMCPICSHSESYNNQKPSSKKAADVRMAKHLLNASSAKEQHRLLNVRIKSGRVRAKRQQTTVEAEE